MTKPARISVFLVLGAVIIGGVSWYVTSKLDSRYYRIDTDGKDIVNPADLQKYSDLRGLRMTPRKIRKADFKNKFEELLTCRFDTLTPWEKMKIPENFKPGEIIELAKDPGLGIRELHRKGLNGKGVKVAAIDMVPLPEHEEYRERIAHLSLTNGKKISSETKTSMHGTVVASLLVGKSCGIAPGASLSFYGYDSAPDFTAEIEGIGQILKYNEGKELIQKIRVVTITRGPNPKFKRVKEFEKALEKALDNGLTVVYVTRKLGGVGCSIYQDRDNPENYVLWNVFTKYKDKLPSGMIYAPCEYRTGGSRRGIREYTYFGHGGLSWAVPYLAGVIALGYQVNPYLKTGEIFQYIRETGTPFNRGWLINPRAFIKKVKDSRQ